MTNPCSDPADVNRLDYFRQYNGMYIGECIDKEGLGLIADHDFMDDWWEDAYGVDFANRYVYDALADADGDGWSNWAENRAMTAPDRSAALSLVRADLSEDNLLEAYPVPTLRVTVAAPSDEPIDASIVIRASSDVGGAGAADATWTVAGSGEHSSQQTRFLGFSPNRLMKFNIGPGSIAQEHVKIQFYDPDYYIETITRDENGGSQVNYQHHNIDTSDWGVISFKDNPAGDSNGENTGSLPGGWVNYANGDIVVDFSDSIYRNTDFRHVISSGNQTTIYHYNLTRAFWRVRSMNRLSEDGAVKTFSMSKADSGYLHEGRQRRPRHRARPENRASQRCRCVHRSCADERRDARPCRPHGDQRCGSESARRLREDA